VQGDQLHIRIRPPAGFWALNSFAVDYTPDRALSVQTIKPATARDLQGTDVLPELVAIDDRYVAMPNIGDTANLTFRCALSSCGNRTSRISPQPRILQTSSVRDR
jgi:hypothetical protein